MAATAHWNGWEIIRREMKTRNLTSKNLANTLGVATEKVRSWETGAQLLRPLELAGILRVLHPDDLALYELAAELIFGRVHAGFGIGEIEPAVRVVRLSMCHSDGAVIPVGTPEQLNEYIPALERLDCFLKRRAEDTCRGENGSCAVRIDAGFCDGVHLPPGTLLTIDTQASPHAGDMVFGMEAGRELRLRKFIPEETEIRLESIANDTKPILWKPAEEKNRFRWLHRVVRMKCTFRKNIGGGNTKSAQTTLDFPE